MGRCGAVLVAQLWPRFTPVPAQPGPPNAAENRPERTVVTRRNPCGGRVDAPRFPSHQEPATSGQYGNYTVSFRKPESWSGSPEPDQFDVVWAGLSGRLRPVRLL